MIPKRVRLLLLVAVVLVASQSLLLAAAVNKNVMVGTNNVGKLTLSDPAVFQNATSGGVTVSGQFEGNYPPLKNGVEIRWVQLIRTSHPLSTATAANTPYFDPGELDMTGDNDPFYWNTALKAKDGLNHPEYFYKNKQINAGKGITFYDQPKRNLTSAPVSWLAELNLVCWETGTKGFDVLWSGTYGFNIAANGAVTVNGFAELANPAFLTQARLTAAFDGWTMGDPKDCLVPEPQSLMALGLLLGAVTPLLRRRR